MYKNGFSTNFSISHISLEKWFLQFLKEFLEEKCEKSLMLEKRPKDDCLLAVGIPGMGRWEGEWTEKAECKQGVSKWVSRA